MQKITAPRAPKTEKKNDDEAAVAFALYLSRHATEHDAPTSMITFDNRETAWNPKSEGFNNVGF